MVVCTCVRPSLIIRNSTSIYHVDAQNLAIFILAYIGRYRMYLVLAMITSDGQNQSLYPHACAHHFIIVCLVIFQTESKM